MSKYYVAVNRSTWEDEFTFAVHKLQLFPDEGRGHLFSDESGEFADGEGLTIEKVTDGVQLWNIHGQQEGALSTSRWMMVEYGDEGFVGLDVWFFKGKDPKNSRVKAKRLGSAIIYCRQIDHDRYESISPKWYKGRDIDVLFADIDNGFSWIRKQQYSQARIDLLASQPTFS